MKIWLLSAALVLSGCGLFGTLVPDQEIAGDALGFDNQISETSTTLNDLTATIRLQAVGAAGTVSGTFNDLEPLPSGSPVPVSFAVTPRLKRMGVLGCSASKDFFNLTFGTLKLELSDVVGQTPRKYELQNNEPTVIKFIKQGSEYVPESTGFVSAGTAFALVWSQIAPIVTKENNTNTLNTGQLKYQVSTDDNSLKNCTLRLTFGSAKGVIKFK
jgi:hypothetical protein